MTTNILFYYFVEDNCCNCYRCCVFLGSKVILKNKRYLKFYQARPRNKNKGTGPPKIYTPPDPTKKEKLEDKEVMKIEINESLFN